MNLENINNADLDYSWYGDAYWSASDAITGLEVAAGTLMVSDEQAERCDDVC